MYTLSPASNKGKEKEIYNYIMISGKFCITLLGLN